VGAEGYVKYTTDWHRCKCVYASKASGAYTVDFNPQDVLKLMGVPKNPKWAKLFLGAMRTPAKAPERR
jgi:hypothetical protein